MCWGCAVSEFRLDIKGDMKRVLKDLGHVDKVLAKRSASSALNRTMTQARTQVVREVAGKLGVKAKPIRQRVAFNRRDRATPRDLSAALRGRLQKLSVTSVMTPAQRGKLRDHIGRGNRKTGTYAAGRLWPSAFIAPTRNRKAVKVFRRKGASRLPIELVGFDVAGPIDASATRQIKRVGPKVFRQNFERDMRYRLTRNR